MLQLLCLLEFVIVSFSSDVLIGNYEAVNDSEIVWQKPHNKDPTAAIFLAHGCAHSATDWWPKSSSCPNCIGLPVEMSIVEFFLSEDFLVVSTSSHDRISKCWREKDIQITANLLKSLYEKLGFQLNQFPLYALGGSSGGYFVSLFATNSIQYDVIVNAIAVQISSIHPSPVQPPTIFIHMERDYRLTSHIKMQVKHLNRRGIASKHYMCKMKNITPDYFHTYGKVLTELESIAFTKALHTAGMINSSGLLLVDPLMEDWIEVAKNTIPGILKRDPLVNDISGLYELMKLAWAHHELTNEYLNETLLFFKNGSRIVHM